MSNDQDDSFATYMRSIKELKAPLSYPPYVRDLYHKLKLGTNPIKLNGSASKRNELYFGDYDFYVPIDRPKEPKLIFEDLCATFKRVLQDPNLYLYRIKLLIGDDKTEYFKPEEFYDSCKFFCESYPNMRYTKIDLIGFDSELLVFKEISCIYDTQNFKDSTEDYLSSLKEDIKEYAAEGSYYKVLKRLNSYYLAINDEQYKKKLLSIFNSKLGKEYEVLNMLRALELLYTTECYKSYNEARKRDIEKKANLMYKELGIKLTKKDLSRFIEKFADDINAEAKVLLGQFKRP